MVSSFYCVRQNMFRLTSDGKKIQGVTTVLNNNEKEFSLVVFGAAALQAVWLLNISQHNMATI